MEITAKLLPAQFTVIKKKNLNQQILFVCAGDRPFKYVKCLNITAVINCANKVMELMTTTSYKNFISNVFYCFFF